MHGITAWCWVEMISNQHLLSISTRHSYEKYGSGIYFSGAHYNFISHRLKLSRNDSRYRWLKPRKINLRLLTGMPWLATLRAPPWLFQPASLSGRLSGATWPWREFPTISPQLVNTREFRTETCLIHAHVTQWPFYISSRNLDICSSVMPIISHYNQNIASIMFCLEILGQLTMTMHAAGLS